MTSWQCVLPPGPTFWTNGAKASNNPFGTIKQWMYQGPFLMRCLENVKGEFSLTALAYNIKRAITLVGVAGLIAAVRA